MYIILLVLELGTNLYCKYCLEISSAFSNSWSMDLIFIVMTINLIPWLSADQQKSSERERVTFMFSEHVIDISTLHVDTSVVQGRSGFGYFFPQIMFRGFYYCCRSNVSTTLNLHKLAQFPSRPYGRKTNYLHTLFEANLHHNTKIQMHGDISDFKSLKIGIVFHKTRADFESQHIYFASKFQTTTL